ncbi:MAG: septal ring lytic transglycosylase RlpA family protein [Sphingomonas sp.]|uniref:septal ring lytic transglycosylase RlpA family protein n=1 Tax=Sphingomonas sp. TaxID=28214 RepID=UPI003F7D3BBA
MRLNNRGLALGLGSCLVLAGCVGGGGRDGPRLVDPTYSDAPRLNYPQDNPPTAPQGGSPVDSTPAPAPARLPYATIPGQPTPLAADEVDAGPPSSAGPSATSGRGAERYDEVGYASWYGNELTGERTASGATFDPKGFTAAHRTLPLGSYVEVTALDTGRTILVQVNDRGPRQNGLLIDLSQGAAQALGVTGREAVRVRAVAASPADFRALRAGQPGAPRLDTPPALLAGLRQRLNGALPAVAGPPMLTPRPPLERIPPEPQAVRPAARQPAPRAAPITHGFYVQVAAFSSQPRANALAKSLGGHAISAGGVWRVRLGPYASQNQARQARDGAAARGYGDARVVRED